MSENEMPNLVLEFILKIILEIIHYWTFIYPISLFLIRLIFL